jgi:hypothetical protein
MIKRTCNNCHQPMPDGKRQDAKYCGPECRSNAEHKRKRLDGRYEKINAERAKANASKPKHRHNCTECGVVYETTHRKPSFCSAYCRVKWMDVHNTTRCSEPGCDKGVRSLGLCHLHHKQAKRSQGVVGYNDPWNERRKANSQQRRAMKLGTQTEKVKSLTVYERDAWTCGLCSTPVDQNLAHPHPMSASLDHVLPLAKGGTHTYTNVQLAHLTCNVSKGARVAA